MRRLLLAATVALFALPVAACSDNTNEPTTAATTAWDRIGAGNAVAFCVEVKDLLAPKTVAPLGVALGQLVADREEGRTAEAAEAEQKIKDEINELASKVTALAAKTDDPQVKAKLETAAARMTQSTDLKFLETVQSIDDLAVPLGTTIGHWFEPIVSLC